MEYSFDIEIAEKHGVNEAIVIKNLQFWITKNKANSKHFYDGQTWTYNSIKAFKELFPFWSERQIRSIFEKLIEKGIIITGNFNKIGYDRTLWYTIIDKSICPISKIHLSEMSNGSDKIDKPIPDSKPVKKPNEIHIESFNKFWTLYDKSVGKKKSEAKWETIPKKYHEAIFKHLEQYVKVNSKQYRKDPYSYLLNETWNDEIVDYNSNPENKDLTHEEKMKAAGFDYE